MSDEEKSISEISRLDDECSLPVEISDDGAGNVLVADLEWWSKGVTLLVAPGTRIQFKVPPRGMHPVWVDYHWNGTNKRVINGVRYEGGSLWHTLQVPPEEDNRARLDGKYNQDGSAESRWTSQHLVVRHPAAFDATNVFSLMVSGTARDGSIITLYANDYLTELGGSTTAQYGKWRVLLYPHVKTQEFVLFETYPGTTGRNPEAKRLIILKGPSIKSPGYPPTADQRPVISGEGAEPGAKVSVYIANSDKAVVLDAPVNNKGEWSATSTHTFELGQKYFINASQELSNVRSERGSNQEFGVLGPPVITKPGSLQTVEMTSPFEGRAPAKHWQNKVTLYSEPSTNLGTAAVNHDTGGWSRNVTLTPGPHSIVGTHTYANVTSIPSRPFTILVRPAKPTASFRPKGEGIELHGTGYNGTGVLVHVNHHSGTPYFEVPVVAGIWTREIPETYVPSLYNLAIRQSVSDGGSGRISSTESVRLDVRVPTPVPTGMAATVSGQKAIFSGRGRQWSTHEVKIAIYNNGTLLTGVPQTRVETNLNWQTAQSSDLAPGVYTNLTARQWVNNQWSPDSATFSMTVASPAPEFINPPASAPTGLRPQISGRAWPGSTIVLKIPNKPDVTLTATGGTFTLNASADWTPGTYALSATAAFGGGQPSAPGTRTFTVGAPVPIITTGAGAEVDLSAEIKGTGFPGCWVFIYSNTTHLPLGGSQVRPDRGWTVTLTEQAPQNLTVYAIQQDAQSSENKSARTATLTVKVRVQKPGITVPGIDGRPARTSMFSGTAATALQGTVELSIKGESQPLIRDIAVKPDGSWEATLTLSVGPKTIEARLRQKTYLSDPLERVITVVPAMPVVDTPRNGEAVGRLLRISGFGYPGDTVQIWRRGDHYGAIGNTVVTPAGKWSAYIPHGLTGTVGISALAKFAGHDSPISLPVTLPVLTPAPQITEPLHDDWVGVRPLYSGLATPGASITVASWFNATDVLAPVKEADVDGRWAVVGNKDLPVGAARVIVRQTLDDKASEWAESERFMVERKVAQSAAPTVHFPLVGQEVGRWPMFSGAGEPGAEILICKDNDPNTVLATTRVDRDGKWAVRSQVELPVAASAYTYSVRQTRDGVASKWLLPNPTVKVIQVPAGFAKPIIDMPEGLTLERRPLFFGRGMPGAELKVHFPSSYFLLATTRVDAQGNWSVRSAVELSVTSQVYNINAQQNMDGQYSAWSDTSRYFRVAEKIDPPVILSPPEGALISPREVIHGTAMPGVEVRFYRSDNLHVVLGKGVADVLGQWELVLDGLPFGDVTLGGKGYKGDLQSPWMPEPTFTVIDAG